MEESALTSVPPDRYRVAILAVAGRRGVNSRTAEVRRSTHKPASRWTVTALQYRPWPATKGQLPHSRSASKHAQNDRNCLCGGLQVKRPRERTSLVIAFENGALIIFYCRVAPPSSPTLFWASQAPPGRTHVTRRACAFQCQEDICNCPSPQEPFKPPKCLQFEQFIYEVTNLKGTAA